MFAPGQHALKCPYCAVENVVPYADETSVTDATEELDYLAYLAQAAGNEALIEVQAVKCLGCGATSQFPPNTTATLCAFCAAPIFAPDAYAHRIIRPRAVAQRWLGLLGQVFGFLKWIPCGWRLSTVLLAEGPSRP